MKRLWCYLFYFTWKIHISLDKYLGKSIKHLYDLFPSMQKHRKETQKAYRYIMNDLTIGYNIYFAYSCMLTTTCIIVANIEICVFYLLNTSLTEILSILLGITLDERINFISFFVSVLFISGLLNEFLLEWEGNGYIKYFDKFRNSSNKSNGFLIAITFHFGAIAICIFLVTYFKCR